MTKINVLGVQDHQKVVLLQKNKKQQKSVFKIPTRKSERIRNKKLQLLSPNIATKRIHINHLPNELLLHIFNYLKTIELWNTVQKVCNKWQEIVHSEQLWKCVVADETVSTDLLETWLKFAPKLQHLKMINRRDADFIFTKVSRFNKHLISIEANSCWGTEKTENLKSVPLCNLLKRCSRLTSIKFPDTSSRSCKFYEMIGHFNSLHDRLVESKTSSSITQQKKSTEIKFVGTINLFQLEALLTAGNNTDATICVSGNKSSDRLVYDVTPENLDAILLDIFRQNIS